MTDFYTQIESYLLGELAPHVRADFDAALHRDAALRTLVDQHRDLLRRLNALRLRNKVKNALQTASFEREAASLTVHRNGGWMMAAAAALVLVAGALWFFGPDLRKDDDPRNQAGLPMDTVVRQVLPDPAAQIPPQENRLTETSERETPPTSPQSDQAGNRRATDRRLAIAYHTDPTDILVRNVADTATGKTLRQQAGEAFAAGDYRQVTELLANVAAPADAELRFLRAHAWFHRADFSRAAADFEALQNSFRFKHEARWNLLLCYLAQGKMDEPPAKALLEPMLADPDFPFHRQAVELSQKR